jgi:hypothetical protein
MVNAVEGNNYSLLPESHEIIICEEISERFNVKSGGTYTYHGDLKTSTCSKMYLWNLCQ